MSGELLVSIVDVLITSGLGLWIGVTFQKNLSNNRALKDYYKEEIQLLNGELSSFTDQLLAGKCNAQDLKEWFKVITIKAETLQNSIIVQLKDVYPGVLKEIIDLKQFVTGTSEFNTQYNNEYLTLDVQSRNKVLEHQKCIKEGIVSLIVFMNRASVR